jgi:hypothetical protein
VVLLALAYCLLPRSSIKKGPPLAAFATALHIEHCLCVHASALLLLLLLLLSSLPSAI